MILADMTFHQFLQNPTGPYSSFFGKRENIKLDLETRFIKLINGTKKKDFESEIYYDKNEYTFHIKIPSEKFDTILYDVIIKLTPNNSAVLTEGTLLNYNLSFFSNSPSFVYTYAYVSKKDKLLLPYMQGKLNPTALTTPPTVKNPIEIYGFEKSIYFALLYIKQKGYHIKTAIPPEVKKKSFSSNTIYTKCKHSDTIMKEYNLEKQKEQLKKKEEKRLAKKQLADNNRKIAEARNKASREKRNKVIKPKKKI